MSFRLQCLDDPTGTNARGRATCDSATTATNVAHVAPVARATPCDKPTSVAHVALSHALPSLGGPARVMRTGTSEPAAQRVNWSL